MNKKVKVLFFIELSFIPSYDGYSTTMTKFISSLSNSDNYEPVVIHCDRGISNTREILKQPFKTYFVNSYDYYNNTELISSIIKKESPDVIVSSCPILINRVLIDVSNKYNIKLVYFVHFLANEMVKNHGLVCDDSEGELHVLKNVDACFVFNDNDKIKLKKKGIDSKRIFLVPFTINIPQKIPMNNKIKNKIIFLGNLYFKPNEDGLVYLIESILPNLGNIKLEVIGDCPIDLYECYKDNLNIEFKGVVKDLNRYLKSSIACVAPIFEGSGVRTKILTSWSFGVPFIGNEIAFSGINIPKKFKKIFLIAEKNRDYLNQIDYLCTKSNRNKIGFDCRKFIEAFYNEDSLAKKLSVVFNNILKIKLSKKQKLSENEIDLLQKQPLWLKEFYQKNRFDIVNREKKNFSPKFSHNGKICEYKKTKTICLEGIRGAGKTTLIGFLENKLGDKLLVIPEIFGKGDMRDSYFYFENDYKKYDMIKQNIGLYDYIIYEKDFIGTLAFIKYCEDKGIYTKSISNNKYIDYFRNYKKLLKDELLFPDIYVYINIPFRTSLSRKPWKTLYTNIRVNHSFQRFYPLYVKMHIISLQKKYGMSYIPFKNNLMKERYLSSIIKMIGIEI